MAKDESSELTDEQLGRLVRRLLGPPEEWDDEAANFVLRVYGIDPADAGRYVKKLLDNIVREKQEKGEPISQMLANWVQIFNQEP
jgi:hypothetical protein